MVTFIHHYLLLLGLFMNNLQDCVGTWQHFLWHSLQLKKLLVMTSLKKIPLTAWKLRWTAGLVHCQRFLVSLVTPLGSKESDWLKPQAVFTPETDYQSETDNPSSESVKCPMDGVRRIVHPKLRPFHFQIKTCYLSDANYPTDNPSLVWIRPLWGRVFVLLG